MSINKIIKAALASFSLPVEANVFIGKQTEYIVFNFEDQRPIIRADDTDLVDEVSVAVHYFIKGKPLISKSAIRKALCEAGFTIINISELYESETKYTHVIFNVWIEIDRSLEE